MSSQQARYNHNNLERDIRNVMNQVMDNLTWKILHSGDKYYDKVLRGELV